MASWCKSQSAGRDRVTRQQQGGAAWVQSVPARVECHGTNCRRNAARQAGCWDLSLSTQASRWMDGSLDNSNTVVAVRSAAKSLIAPALPPPPPP